MFPNGGYGSFQFVTPDGIIHDYDGNVFKSTDPVFLAYYSASNPLNLFENLSIIHAGLPNEILAADNNEHALFSCRIDTFTITHILGVYPSGSTTTALPAPAASSTIAGMKWLAVDAAGNIYIYSGIDKKIYAINRQTTTQVLCGVTVLPGYVAALAYTPETNVPGYPGEAQKIPIVFCCDGAGNLYFDAYGYFDNTADPTHGISGHAWNDIQIRRIDAVTGAVSGVAGSVVPILTAGASAPAVMQGSFPQSPLAPYLGQPTALTCDSLGNLYFATTITATDDHSDVTQNGVIVGINFGATPQVMAGISVPTGEMAIVAGPGVGHYFTYLPTGDGGAATSAYLFTTQALSVDSYNNLYAACYGHPGIRVINAETGIITRVAGTYVTSGTNTGPGTPAITTIISLDAENNMDAVVLTTCQLAVNSESLQFSKDQCDPAPSTQSVAVVNLGTSGPVAFTVSANQPWVTFAANSGMTPATIAVGINPAGLAPGTYNAILSFGSASCGNPTVAVTLVIGQTVVASRIPDPNANAENVPSLNGVFTGATTSGQLVNPPGFPREPTTFSLTRNRDRT